MTAIRWTVVAAVGLCATTPAFAQDPLADTGTTRYTLVPEESDNVRAAIDHAVQHMNFIVRPIARRRLTRNNRLPAHVTFAVRPDTIAVTFDGSNAIVTPRNGDTVSWTRAPTRDTHEEHYMVRAVVAGDTLQQTILTDDGGRENDFVFLDGGTTLELHVRLWADRLPTPLVYTLVFRREPPGAAAAP